MLCSMPMCGRSLLVLLVFCLFLFWLVLLYFDVVFGVAHLVHEVFCYSVSVVALEYYLGVFGRASAGAVGFHFLGQSAHVCVFVVYAVDNGDCSAEFSCF